MYRSIKSMIPQPAVIGRIKIGGLSPEKRTAKSGREWAPPVKYPHFWVTGMDRDETGNFAPDPEVMRRIGGPACQDPGCKLPKPHQAPTEIEVLLLDDDPEFVFPHHLAYYGGRKCLCRGDGETAERREVMLKLVGPEEHPGPMVPPEEQAKLRARMQAGEYGGWVQIKCPPEACRFFSAQEDSKPCCKALGRLYVAIPKYRPVLGGVYLFSSQSTESIRSIAYTLQELAARTGGILEGIPLKLRVYPKTDQTEKGQMTSYKVALVFDPGDRLADLALSEHAKQVASIRAASMADLRALRERQRKALVAADAEFVEAAAVEPPENGDHDEAEGFHGGIQEGAFGQGASPRQTEAKPEAQPEPAATKAEQDGLPF